MPTIDYVALDAEAVRTSIELVGTATPADLSKPTPCRAWTLYGLLAHMATQHYGFAAASRGENDPEIWKVRDLGDDPVKAYVESAEHVLDAFAQPGVVERTFPMAEFGPDAAFPGAQAISFHFIDYVVHSWDVAKSLGTTVSFSPEALAAAQTVAQVVPVGDVRHAPGAPFAADVAWSGDDALDGIVAYLGRNPSWPN
ncbi:TIGR03086 family metal-binding protein [Kribbella sp.]|uniref:TIGR03086 family metal-binding protein n=1 Tax=Kribbella sp. TaxID=1871183 RepID=UPI002D523BE9|nr:TIGR03086 family metal-binding protein [Kribbella sp.]HZX03846.1 TIGR03086 family metal-binding protein [Kribbella sp.]